MSLSLVIPAFNEDAWLPATLASVRRAEAGIEIIVVDNDSSDRTADVAASYGATIIREHEHNVARVRNAGASAANGDVVVFLDADTLVPERLFSRIAEIMQDRRCLGGAVDIDHQPKRAWVRVYLELWRRFGRLMGMAEGAAQFCRRDAFLALGGYDERLLMGEDVDFYWRLTRFAKRQGGYVHFIDDLQVLSSPRRYDQWPAWRILLWTNPLFALLFRRRRSIWRGWYDDLVR